MPPIPKVKNNVLLFGTSANPPTGRGGHGGILKFYCESGNYDAIWVIPVYCHMFKKKRGEMMQPGMATFDQRLEMCRLAFESYGSDKCAVEIMPIERDLCFEKAKKDTSKDQMRVSTYELLTYLKAKYPMLKFDFLIGMDSYIDLLNGKWAYSKELLEKMNFIVIQRDGISSHCRIPADVQCDTIADLTNLSSTKVRNSTDIKFLKDSTVLCPSVFCYIEKYHLYNYGRLRLRRKTFILVLVSAGIVTGLFLCRNLYNK